MKATLVHAVENQIIDFDNLMQQLQEQKHDVNTMHS